jgi:hypothetical protein
LAAVLGASAAHAQRHPDQLVRAIDAEVKKL